MHKASNELEKNIGPHGWSSLAGSCAICCLGVGLAL